MSKGNIFVKKMLTSYLQKEMLTSAKLRELGTKGMFSETAYMCLITYKISNFQPNDNEF